MIMMVRDSFNIKICTPCLTLPFINLVISQMESAVWITDCDMLFTVFKDRNIGLLGGRYNHKMLEKQTDADTFGARI